MRNTYPQKTMMTSGAPERMQKNKMLYTTIKGKNKPSAFQYQGKSADKDKTKVPTADLNIGRHRNKSANCRP